MKEQTAVECCTEMKDGIGERLIFVVVCCCFCRSVKSFSFFFCNLKIEQRIHRKLFARRVRERKKRMPTIIKKI